MDPVVGFFAMSSLGVAVGHWLFAPLMYRYLTPRLRILASLTAGAISFVLGIVYVFGIR